MNTIDSLFDWFLSATLRGSLLIGAILLVQFILRRSLPATWRHALWFPALFVLGSPYLPERPWSLENRFASDSAPLVLRVTESPEAFSFPPSGELPSTVPSSESPFPWKFTASILWLAGVGLTLAIGLISYFRTRRTLSASQATPSSGIVEEVKAAADALRLRRLPILLVTRHVSSPAVTGLIRPVLLLPDHFTETFSSGERHLILLHELTHLRRLDLPLNWIVFAIQCLHWCNPLVWSAFARLRADRESACDSAVLSASATDCRRVYGQALLKLESSPISAPGRLAFIGLVGWFVRGQSLRLRIGAISRHRKSHPAWAIPGISLLLALTLLGATKESVGGPEDPSTNQIQFTEQFVDGKEPQILIEATLIEVPENQKIEISAKGSTLDLTRGSGSLVQSEIEAEQFITTLTKLPTVDILSAPKIVTLSGKESEIQIGEESASDQRFVSLKILPGLQDGVIDLDLSVVSRQNSREQRLVNHIAIKSGETLVMVSPPHEEANPGEGRLVLTMKAGIVDSSAALYNRLSDIILPEVEFRDASLSRALEFLRHRAKELNPETGDFDLISAPSAQESDVRITLKLANVPLTEALRYSAELAGMDVNYDDRVVTIQPKKEVTEETTPAPVSTNQGKTAALAARIVLPRVEFKEVLLADALAFLRAKSEELDPAKNGLNLILNSWSESDPIPPKITISLTNVPLSSALRYITDIAGMKLRYEDDAVVISRE